MKKILFFFFAFLLLLLGCTSQDYKPYNYQIPEQLEDGLKVSTLDGVKIDTLAIYKTINQIRKGRFGEVHSLLIYKNGRLVLEEYFPGHQYQWDGPRHWGNWVQWDRTMPHFIMSDTKSITSACIGIAIAEGFIRSEKQSIFDYLPEHRHFAKNGKEKIIIEHLLTMTSGLEWEEWEYPYSNRENPIIGIWFSGKDPIRFILEGTLEHEPGAHYSYFGGHQILLGEILRNATGMGIDEFSEKYLFSPLGVVNADWAVRFDNGVVEAAGGLKLKPRDMLKVGITFLNEGRWKDETIVPKAWVKRCTTPYKGNTNIRVPGTDSKGCGYTYSWWTQQIPTQTSNVNAFWAGGWGGQRIFVLPELNAVVVMTGGNYTGRDKSLKLLKKHIIFAL